MADKSSSSSSISPSGTKARPKTPRKNPTPKKRPYLSKSCTQPSQVLVKEVLHEHRNPKQPHESVSYHESTSMKSAKRKLDDFDCDKIKKKTKVDVLCAKVRDKKAMSNDDKLSANSRKTSPRVEKDDVNKNKSTRQTSNTDKSDTSLKDCSASSMETQSVSDSQAKHSVKNPSVSQPGGDSFLPDISSSSANSAEANTTKTPPSSSLPRTPAKCNLPPDLPHDLFQQLNTLSQSVSPSVNKKALTPSSKRSRRSLFSTPSSAQKRQRYTPIKFSWNKQPSPNKQQKPLKSPSPRKSYKRRLYDTSPKKLGGFRSPIKPCLPNRSSTPLRMCDSPHIGGFSPQLGDELDLNISDSEDSVMDHSLPPSVAHSALATNVMSPLVTSKNDNATGIIGNCQLGSSMFDANLSGIEVAATEIVPCDNVPSAMNMAVNSTGVTPSVDNLQQPVLSDGTSVASTAVISNVNTPTAQNILVCQSPIPAIPTTGHIPTVANNLSSSSHPAAVLSEHPPSVSNTQDNTLTTATTIASTPHTPTDNPLVSPSHNPLDTSWETVSNVGTPQVVRDQTELSEEDSPSRLTIQFPEDMPSIDKELIEKSKKVQFSARNVRSLLHEVVSNKDVMDMVMNTLREDDQQQTYKEARFEPKMTRARFKQTVKSGNGPWPMSPVKLPADDDDNDDDDWSSQFINLSFSDEEDDEYTPNHAELESDEESMVSSQASDFGSPLPRTPHRPPPTHTDSSPSSSDNMKAPSTLPRPLHIRTEEDVVEKDTTIARRTRSKLPLNDTPLEVIESDFVAPDITPDMYDTQCDDTEWNEFLTSLYTKPNLLDGVMEEETGDDPEYVYQEEQSEDDTEERRDDKAVRVTKKELNELMDELFEAYGGAHLLSSDEDDTPGSVPELPCPVSATTPPRAPAKEKAKEMKDVKEVVSEDEEDTYPGRLQPLDLDPKMAQVLVCDLQQINNKVVCPVRLQLQAPSVTMTPTEVIQLQDQMRKHVQLLAQSYVQASARPGITGEELDHPDIVHVRDAAQGYLLELKQFTYKYVSNPEQSMFNTVNLDGAIELTKQSYEPRDPDRQEQLRKNVTQTIMSSQMYDISGLTYEQMEVMMTSKVFVFPQMLPITSLLPKDVPMHRGRVMFTEAEDSLLAMGLDQFGHLPNKFILINQFLVPTKSRLQLRFRLKNRRNMKAEVDNVLSYYLQHNKLPDDIPRYLELESESEIVPPRDRDPDLLPNWWRAFRLAEGSLHEDESSDTQIETKSDNFSLQPLQSPSSVSSFQGSVTEVHGIPPQEINSQTTVVMTNIEPETTPKIALPRLPQPPKQSKTPKQSSKYSKKKKSPKKKKPQNVLPKAKSGIKQTVSGQSSWPQSNQPGPPVIVLTPLPATQEVTVANPEAVPFSVHPPTDNEPTGDEFDTDFVPSAGVSPVKLPVISEGCDLISHAFSHATGISLSDLSQTDIDTKVKDLRPSGLTMETPEKSQNNAIEHDYMLMPSVQKLSEVDTANIPTGEFTQEQIQPDIGQLTTEELASTTTDRPDNNIPVTTSSETLSDMQTDSPHETNLGVSIQSVEPLHSTSVGTQAGECFEVTAKKTDSTDAVPKVVVQDSAVGTDMVVNTIMNTCTQDTVVQTLDTSIPEEAVIKTDVRTTSTETPDKSDNAQDESLGTKTVVPDTPLANSPANQEAMHLISQLSGEVTPKKNYSPWIPSCTPPSGRSLGFCCGGTPKKSPLRFILPKAQSPSTRPSPVLMSPVRSKSKCRRQILQNKARAIAPKGLLVKTFTSPVKKAADRVVKKRLGRSPAKPPWQSQEFHRISRKSQEVAKEDLATNRGCVEENGRAVEDPIDRAGGSELYNSSGQEESGGEDYDLEQLMTACTTIRSAAPVRRQLLAENRKLSKADQKREVLLDTLAPDLLENDVRRDEKDTKYAQAYLRDVQRTLTNDPDTHLAFLEAVYEHGKTCHTSVELYHQLSCILTSYPDLLKAFSSFLRPDQAKESDCLQENLTSFTVRSFFRKLEVQLQKQPLLLQKIVKEIVRWNTDPNSTLTELRESVEPLLRGHGYLREEFLQMFYDEKPPESAMSEFEQINLCDSDDDESNHHDSFEEVELPDIESHLGTSQCDCRCHDVRNKLYQQRKRHCQICGLKIIKGKFYMQVTDKVLQPMKIVLQKSPEKSAGSCEENEEETSDLDTDIMLDEDSQESSDGCDWLEDEDHVTPIANEKPEEVNKSSDGEDTAASIESALVESTKLLSGEEGAKSDVWLSEYDSPPFAPTDFHSAFRQKAPISSQIKLNSADNPSEDPLLDQDPMKDPVIDHEDQDPERNPMNDSARDSVKNPSGDQDQDLDQDQHQDQDSDQDQHQDQDLDQDQDFVEDSNDDTTESTETQGVTQVNGIAPTADCRERLVFRFNLSQINMNPEVSVDGDSQSCFSTDVNSQDAIEGDLTSGLTASSSNRTDRDVLKSLCVENTDSSSKSLDSGGDIQPINCGELSEPISLSDSNHPISSEYLAQPITDNSPQPISSGDSNPNMTSTDSNQPITSGDSNPHPISSEDSNQPITSGDSNPHPISSEDSNQPITSGDSNPHPISSEDSNQPITSGDSSHPFTSSDSNQPITSVDSNHPLTSSDSNPPMGSSDLCDNQTSSGGGMSCGNISESSESSWWTNNNADNTITWSRDEDRLIIQKCNECGARLATFTEISHQLTGKTPVQIGQRFGQLVRLFEEVDSDLSHLDEDDDDDHDVG